MLIILVSLGENLTLNLSWLVLGYASLLFRFRLREQYQNYKNGFYRIEYKN